MFIFMFKLKLKLKMALIPTLCVDLVKLQIFHRPKLHYIQIINKQDILKTHLKTTPDVLTERKQQ